MGSTQLSHESSRKDDARRLLVQGADDDHVLLPTGESAAIQRLVRQIRQVARFDSRVLIMGATGTGKEIVARAIHALSPRRDRLFVPINCGAIPAELLESELFGHVKGAFSGAIAARQGRFELAEGGTLFLDEIGEMSLSMQVKLLRVLQERSFERVGSSQSTPCDVRVIAATHRNLRQRVADGTFREDLYHRLNVVELRTPDLRERTEDLPELIENFIAQNLAAGRDEVRLGRRALAALRRYEWPGNVRELENLIERLAVMCGGHVVELDDLPEAIAAVGGGMEDTEAGVQPPAVQAVAALLERVTQIHTEATGRHLRFVPPVAMAEAESEEPAAMAPMATIGAMGVAAAGPSATTDFPPGGIDLAERLRTVERRYMEIALELSGGVLSRAAILLGLKRTTLMDKLRRHGLGAAAQVDGQSDSCAP
jgi:sigma-54 specific flagellar transcriptional regulator A